MSFRVLGHAGKFFAWVADGPLSGRGLDLPRVGIHPAAFHVDSEELDVQSGNFHLPIARAEANARMPEMALDGSQIESIGLAKIPILT